MIDRRIYFEESYECPGSAESMEISVEFPTANPEARYAEVMFSPTKDGEDYDWFDVLIPLDEIEELMALAERSVKNG